LSRLVTEGTDAACVPSMSTVKAGWIFFVFPFPIKKYPRTPTLSLYFSVLWDKTSMLLNKKRLNGLGIVVDA